MWGRLLHKMDNTEDSAIDIDLTNFFVNFITTVSNTNLLAVLNSFAKILRLHFENGEIVRFGGFNSYQISQKEKSTLTQMLNL